MSENTELRNRMLGITTEVGGGIATDFATSGLLAGGPLGLLGYGLINFGQGAYTNYLVQKHLYGKENVNVGEVISSGFYGLLPFMNIGASAKAAKYVGKAGSVQRGLVGGGLTAVAGEQLRVGIDEKRVLNPSEALMAGGLGSALSGGLAKFGQQADDAKKYAREATKRQIKQQNIAKYEEITQKGAARKEKIGDLQYNLNSSIRGWRSRPAPANTLEFDTPEKMLAKMDDVALDLGYESPKNIITIAPKPHVEEGLPTPPVELESIYNAHQIAYWKEIQLRKDANPNYKGNMEPFPDFIHQGFRYRPRPHAVDGQLDYARIISYLRLQAYKKRGVTKRINSLNRLNELTGNNNRSFFTAKKDGFAKLNAKLAAEGKDEIDATTAFSGGVLEGDHIIPVELTDRYIRDLPDKKLQQIVVNAMLDAGGYLGDDPQNITLITKTLNNTKKSYLGKLLKSYKHKSARSFGKDYKARVLYYTTPSPITNLTPIEEYVKATYLAEQWAAEQFNKILADLPVMRPGELNKLPKDEYKALIEIFGSKEDVLAFYKRMEADIIQWKKDYPKLMGEPLPTGYQMEALEQELKEEFLQGELWFRISGERS